MRKPDYYEADGLAFFAGRPWALPLYEALFSQMEELFPEAAVKVQKSQISFYGLHLFAAVSLPLRRKKTWPEECLVVTFGLGSRVEDPRIAAAVEREYLSVFPGLKGKYLYCGCMTADGVEL